MGGSLVKERSVAIKVRAGSQGSRTQSSVVANFEPLPTIQPRPSSVPHASSLRGPLGKHMRTIKRLEQVEHPIEVLVHVLLPLVLRLKKHGEDVRDKEVVVDRTDLSHCPCKRWTGMDGGKRG